jgi:hypothetical protein
VALVCPSTLDATKVKAQNLMLTLAETRIQMQGGQGTCRCREVRAGNTLHARRYSCCTSSPNLPPSGQANRVPTADVLICISVNKQGRRSFCLNKMVQSRAVESCPSIILGAWPAHGPARVVLSVLRLLWRAFRTIRPCRDGAKCDRAEDTRIHRLVGSCISNIKGCARTST